MSTMYDFPFIVAQKQGIYDSLRLHVNFIYFTSAVDRDAAFQSGKIDGAVTDYLSAAVLQYHHVPLKFIMKNDGYFCFIVSKQSRINNRKQLKGQNIAISRNTIVEYATDQLLDKAAISTSEVNEPEIGQIPIRLQMLQYGQIEATFLPDPFASIAMSSGNKSLISTRELGIDFVGTAFSQKALNEKNREIKLLVEGYSIGVKYLQTHSPKEWKQLLIEEIGIPEMLAGLIALPSYEVATLPSAKNIAKAVAWLKARGRIPKTFQETNLIDTTFITSKKHRF